ncbi:MAG TPA: glutamate formimidoyltransferase, partial [Actinomycetota bacterium]|nr:glutamate formimidoyltransferase [Actinomycetota bacterium]
MDPNALVVCVPNFSEGRRREVIDAICEALAGVPGARLVYRQADPEHHRLDTTVVGPPAAVRSSALAGAAKAVELIDMDEHRGGHPRMGAADVIPFVPLRGISMEEVVELARDSARELAETLDLPVYLYDRAALVPERVSLAQVRRGEYEGLREAVARGERLPDLGPHRIGKAGATAVGARKPLIAFNVYLTGTEEGTKEIAKLVRESSGGLPAVRAIGFAVPERDAVTVSMNLIDFETTGVRTAFDAVRGLATERGMEVLASEIVGLVPQAALAEGDIQHVRLEGFDADGQILERLVNGGDGFGGQTIAGFLDVLGSDAPTPGGGAVAGLCGAAGAALISMVCNLTIGKRGYEDVEDRMRTHLGEAEEARPLFLDLSDRDAASFEAVMAAFRMPKDDDRQKAERSAAIQRAYEGAARVPLELARRAVDLLPAAIGATELGNANAASDGVSAAISLHAAAACALVNVEINAAGLKDEAL